MRTINAIRADLELAENRVEQLNNELQDAISAVGNQVTVVKRGETLTLTHGSRVLKAKKNSYGHWTVKENGRVIYWWSGGIRQLKVAVAEGRV